MNHSQALPAVIGLFAAFFSPSPLRAQSPPVQQAVAIGCGPESETFSVKTDSTQHPMTQPDSGKALVYFLEDDDEVAGPNNPTTRMGIDGAWVGANQGDSYFYVNVAPGEHHLCADWQKAILLHNAREAAALHFTAQAGGIYFFRVRSYWSGDKSDIKFRADDSDEAQLLMSRYAFSTSKPKK